MKYAELTEDQRKSRNEYINDRWKELAAFQRDAGTQAATYLMVTNSGGAVAILSFMGAMKTTTPIVHAPAMLMAFLLGIILVGIGRAYVHYRISARFDRWRTAVNHFYDGDWTWIQTRAYDDAMGTTSPLGATIAWAAFACFISGVALGLGSLP